ncbi:hypothetical protein PSA7680_01135 [Pseudoruegeria aquimaris]|uniref:UDP-N-acetylmuramate--alanine ligase n=1 Tax=Pseudoruegeria aquimaris TaxID=393663 RepID=A0A1Y5RVI6_9RHOB|nr:DUF2484 family protein [Pseudoruegeria aquimaris]SLN26137.1 hypothetical protein PSA7680_01135 [Pseudoruegeria aquimaris]
MSAALLAGCLWVLAAAGVAMLPMRHQFAPGVILLALAPVVIVWLARVHGVWIGVAGFAAFVSMFRRPLKYYGNRLWARVRGVPQ